VRKRSERARSLILVSGIDRLNPSAFRAWAVSKKA
jgi:hypothetical protein